MNQFCGIACECLAALEGFGASIYLLIGGIIFATIAVLVLLGAWIAFKQYLRRRRQREADAQRHAELTRPDGLPYPPTGRGMCDKCGQAFEKVYHTAHRRLCRECYMAEFPVGETPDQPASGRDST